MATNDTLDLSRRIVAAVDPDGTRFDWWCKWQEPWIYDGPNLSLPENLHHAYKVADAADLGHSGKPAEVRWIVSHFECPYWVPSLDGYLYGTGATRNEALMDATAKAKGVK